MTSHHARLPESSRLKSRAEALRKGLLAGAAVVMLVLPSGNDNAAIASPAPAPDTSVMGAASSSAARPVDAAGQGAQAAADKKRSFVRLAHFGDAPASAEARHVANWALHSGDNKNMNVVVVDKREAKVFVFDREGRLLGHSPVLLGSMVGDHTVPGVGDKPLAQVKPEERTTPAGRFIAEIGLNASGEDVVWVDYDAAVSMHRVRPTVKSERRLERLASATPDDNRISYGCINLPKAFYEKVLSPTVRQRGGAVIYVLPETRTPQQVFRSYDVPHADVLALFATPSR